MLKYLYTKEVFNEVPGEISLGISISGCRIHCPDCHSKELWQDLGTPLTPETLSGLLDQHQGITCLLLLGGEHDIDALAELFMLAHKRVKTAWYSGLEQIPYDKLGILDYLDYIKTGSYIKARGGLDNPLTNQNMYEVKHRGNKYELINITELFWKNDS